MPTRKLDESNPGLERTHYQLRASGATDETANPLRSGIHTRGYLPHVKREGASSFVTFRLADASASPSRSDTALQNRDCGFSHRPGLSDGFRRRGKIHLPNRCRG
jgi:hypothetical protein